MSLEGLAITQYMKRISYSIYELETHLIIIPELCGKDGSFRVSVSSRQAAPSEWFRPASQDSTVFTETPMYLANITCVSPMSLT